MPTIIDAVEILDFATRAGDNILNENLTFNKPFSANIVSGSGTANTSLDLYFSGRRSLYVNNLSSTETLVVSGGGSNWFTDFTGSYVTGVRSILQFSIYNNNGLGTVITGRVRVFVSGFETYIIEFSDTGTASWKTFFANIPMQSDIDFIIELDPLTEGCEMYFDGFKFEIDDKGTSIPTAYTGYVPFIYETTQAIDVPSIGSNSYYAVVVTLEGAEIGDYVTMTYPSEIITLGLIVGYPIVTDTDEVSVLIHNHSGGSVNPASGDYTFKIVK
jgi:hypothetical protein